MQTTYERFLRHVSGFSLRRPSRMAPMVLGALALAWLGMAVAPAGAGTGPGADSAAAAPAAGPGEAAAGDGEARDGEAGESDAEQQEREALAERITARAEWLFLRLLVPLAAVSLLALALFMIPRVRRMARASALPVGSRTALHGFVLAAFGYFVFAAASAFIMIGAGPTAGDYANPIATVGAQALALVALAWMIREVQRMPFGAIGLGGRQAGNRGLRAILCWSVVLYFAQLPGLVGCMQIAGTIFPRQLQPQVLDVARNPEIFYRAIYFVSVVALAPVLEELIFRGLVMDACRRATGPAIGVIASALLFMVVHTPEAYIPIFWLGMVLALAYHYTGSLVAPIAIHLLHNLGQFLMLLWAASAA